MKIKSNARVTTTLIYTTRRIADHTMTLMTTDHLWIICATDGLNAIPYCRGIQPAQLLEVLRIMSIHNNATKRLIPYDDITVWDTGTSIPFHSAYFFYFTYKYSHTDQCIVLLEQIAVFSTLIYTQPFVMGCGAAVKYCALFSFENRYENPMSCAFNVRGETMLHGYERILFFSFFLFWTYD